MQSTRLLVIVFIGTVILCGALLMIGCNDSSSGGNDYNGNCTFPNVQSSPLCKGLSDQNTCKDPFTYDSKNNICYTYTCSACMQ
jgi:hypothetical protein